MSTDESGSTGDDEDADVDVEGVEEVGGDDDDASSPHSPEDEQADVVDEVEQEDLRPRMSSGEEFGLPAGWQVEERPRLSGKLKGRFDKYYIEPETNKRFRSMVEVKEHLQIDDLPTRKIKRRAGRGQVDSEGTSSSTSERGRGRGRRGSRGRGRGRNYGPLSQPVLRPFARGTTLPTPPPPHHRVVFVAKRNDGDDEPSDDC
ncbi:unnamed protein product [Linum tenue]|uniref:MBD domain-containing protein n=1 Tax=Linum tenue TaxID=586396 RepID=A0AAV0JU17_9ROSI|nr:unnamed protein product [Linum tenue]